MGYNKYICHFLKGGNAMIRSMTGFGRCRDTVNGKEITVTITLYERLPETVE